LAGGFKMKITVKTIEKVKPADFAKEVLIIFAGFVTLAFLARVTLPLWFTPVPLTGSTLGVFLVASILGCKRATSAVISYIIAGGLGLPVFAYGAFGFAVLAGTTGGYIIGYVFAASVIGFMFDRGWGNTYLKRVLIITIGCSALFITGLIQLSFFVPAGKVLAYGLYPFIPGEIFKICLAASLVGSARKFVGV
jgi:biotin transport system substrate-specific component